MDYAKGEWIGFVDSDDWIEADMYETLLKKAEETKAEIVECGIIEEYDNKTEVKKWKNMLLSGTEAMSYLLRKELLDNVWNKIWKKDFFDQFRFPEGKLFEDISTTYKVLIAAEKVCIIDQIKYHHVQHEGSISTLHDMKNLLDFWYAHLERYKKLFSSIDEESQQELCKYCAVAAARTWTYFYDNPDDERRKYDKEIRNINAFVRQHLPLFGRREWVVPLRIGAFLAHYNNSLSLRTANTMGHLYKHMKKGIFGFKNRTDG